MCIYVYIYVYIYKYGLSQCVKIDEHFYCCTKIIVQCRGPFKLWRTANWFCLRGNIVCGLTWREYVLIDERRLKLLFIICMFNAGQNGENCDWVNIHQCTIITEAAVWRLAGQPPRALSLMHFASMRLMSCVCALLSLSKIRTCLPACRGTIGEYNIVLACLTREKWVSVCYKHTVQLLSLDRNRWMCARNLLDLCQDSWSVHSPTTTTHGVLMLPLNLMIGLVRKMLQIF